MYVRSAIKSHESSPEQACRKSSIHSIVSNSDQRMNDPFARASNGREHL
jgi:hypothetical protein